MTRLALIAVALVLALPCPAASPTDKSLAISTLAELATAAAQSGQTVTMKPGVYRLTDLVPLSAVPDRRKRGEWQFLTFSGSSNVFHLDGVTIEFDTALRAALHAPIHTDEFLIKGGGNMLSGLTITNFGDGKAQGGAVLGITGKGNTVRECTVHVCGSAPYGYGDLFGKGGLKHSGVHITGSGTRLIGCKVFTRAFGHAFYLQEDAADCYFENCHAEGAMRSTDEILMEKSGLAFDRKFRTEMKNHSGEARIQPGYMKALSEDGFRTYGQHKNLVLKSCTAKNMRGGFELRTKTAPRLENCTATGCERGFWVGDGAVVAGCRGDAQFGPLLYAEGDKATVEVELLPAEAAVTLHAVAAIQGVGNKVAILSAPDGGRVHALPILVGFGPPGMGENMAPFSERNTRDLQLRNETMMPVVIGEKADKSEIITRGPVKENKGRGLVIRQN